MSKRRATIKTKTGPGIAPNERIIEFSFPSGRGGLISFRETVAPDPNEPATTVHTCIVDLYRLDNGITVLSPEEHTKTHRS